jgi:putative peptide zinc metalloprotease protein
MSPLRRRATLLALTLLACVAPFGVAQAHDGASRENVATAVVEQDGAGTFDFAWQVRRQRGGVIDHYNAARAAARCVDCRATAIAFQIVLVVGRPDAVNPRNVSIAINDQCTRCVTYAGARQFVRVVDQPVRITRSGRRELFDVRRTLRRLESLALGVAELTAAVEREEARVNRVLLEELVPADDASGEEDVRVLDSENNQDNAR